MKDTEKASLFMTESSIQAPGWIPRSPSSVRQDRSRVESADHRDNSAQSFPEEMNEWRRQGKEGYRVSRSAFAAPARGGRAQSSAMAGTLNSASCQAPAMRPPPFGLVTFQIRWLTAMWKA